MKPYAGIIPALSVPLLDNQEIDERGFRRLVRWVADHDGITGVLTNGHTGEVFALLHDERAKVTRLAAEELGGSMPVISAVNCEGIREAQQHAREARDAGATAILVMPPHMWLRFGMRQEHVIDYFQAIHDACGLDLVVHVYPAWTRASYSTDTMLALGAMPAVKAFKIGTRDMNKYAYDLRVLREASPDKTLLTCHDEYLLASMVQGVDGALVGFASFLPDLIIGLWNAVQRGDFSGAREYQERINPLKDVVYGRGEPSSDAHARMKYAMYRAGIIDRPVVRDPTRQPASAEREAIERALQNAGRLTSKAA
ncbi:dihydrodipicolinate synthase family protein [Prosthecomicrobium sp. N25]|uniref:dihydrodipicolinate synthase family protein n=1 Tax=Prosthecomicrobium sp. N25 TaxID=3129254 RepID=UPI0030787E08